MRKRSSPKQYSNFVPETKLAFLTLITFGFYPLIALNWVAKEVQEVVGKEERTSWRGPWIRRFPFYYEARYFEDICEVLHVAHIRVRWSPGLLRVTYNLLLFGILLCTPLTNSVVIIALIVVLSLIPAFLMQDALNEFWSFMHHKLPIRHWFTTDEIILSVLGAVIWSALIYTKL